MTFFAPASITAFFSPHISGSYSETGSTGLGITLEAGVFAKVSEKKGIRLNSKSFTFPTIELLLEKLGVTEAKIELVSQIPVGYGFGFSGASCLAAAFALNTHFDLKKGYFELADIVHECEVRSRTGLGDVVCQTQGGIVLRKTPGCPSKAVIEKYFSESEINFLILGSISTSDILGDEEIVEKIRKYGAMALKKFQVNPDFYNIFSISKDFAVQTGLMDEEILEIIGEIERMGYRASMVMLGKVIFTDCPLKILKDYGDVFSSKISQFGVRRA